MIKKDKPDLDEVLSDLWKRTGREVQADAVCSFPQIHKGPSGFIMSYTTVIFEGYIEQYHVYFDGKYAYSVLEPNEMFLEDLERGALKPADMVYLYQKEIINEG